VKSILTISTILLVVSFGLEAQAGKNISFWHIGTQDRSFVIVTINTARGDGIYLSPEDRKIYAYHKVDETSYEEIKSFIQERYEITNAKPANAQCEFGTFEIIIEEGDEKKYLYLVGRIKSIPFFYKLIDHLSEKEHGEGIESLIEALDEILVRLIYNAW
jgi:hypothetical protein